MRKNLFIVGVLVAVASFLVGFTTIDEGKQTKGSQSCQQVTDCQQKHAQGECKQHKEGACADKCKEKCKGDCSQQCKEECKTACEQKHASGQCQGHEAGACKGKEGKAQKVQPKKSDKK